MILSFVEGLFWFYATHHGVLHRRENVASCLVGESSGEHGS